jgi:hypothetical protein
MLLYIIKTPQSLTSKIAGKAHFHRWTREKTFLARQRDIPPDAEEEVVPAKPSNVAVVAEEKTFLTEQSNVAVVAEEKILQPADESNVEEEMLETRQEETVEPAIEAYCMKCRQKRTMLMPRRVTTKNGRTAMEGSCPTCSTKLFRFI